MRKVLSLLLALLLLFSCGCTQANGGTGKDTEQTKNTENHTNNTKTDTEGTTAPVTVLAESELFTDRDSRTSYTESECIKIVLNENSITASDTSVIIDGTTVTITKDTAYIISGTLDNGQIIVNAPESAKLQLVFKNASITSKDSAALYIKEADKVFITLVGENALANGGSFVTDENNVDGALFSKQDLTVNGDGKLTVTSPAGHGIVCKDDLVLTGGTYTVTAASHGFDANDSIRIKDAVITVAAGKDALHAENNDDASLGFIYVADSTLDLTAEGDGISAGAYLQIPSGNITVLAGGGYENGEQHSSDAFGGFPGGFGGGGGGKPRSGETTQSTDTASTSMKGLKSAGDIYITGGTFTLDTADDAIHANASLTVGSGTFDIFSGDDALHAEDTLTVTNGSIDVKASYEGLEALHIHVDGGDIRLVSSDDGLNAAGGIDQSGMTGGRDGMFGGRFGGGFSSNSSGSISITGGTLYIEASGDGIDANGTLEITGGYTTVAGPTNGDTATLDYDTSATITGGTFLGTGASMMAQTFSDSEQGVIAVQISGQVASTKITVTDKDGNVLISHTPTLPFQVMILSTPDMVSGQSYTLTVGSLSKDITAK